MSLGSQVAHSWGWRLIWEKPILLKSLPFVYWTQYLTDVCILVRELWGSNLDSSIQIKVDLTFKVNVFRSFLGHGGVKPWTTEQKGERMVYLDCSSFVVSQLFGGTTVLKWGEGRGKGNWWIRGRTWSFPTSISNPLEHRRE